MEIAIKENNENLLSVLQDIQEEYNYLPEEQLIEVAERLDVPLIDVYGVATFYQSFSLTPRGRHHVKVCLGTACHVRGSSRVEKQMERKLGIRPGETSEDGEFSLETVMCLGCCAIGPVVVIDGEYHGHIIPGKVQATINSCKKSPGDGKK